MCIYIYMYIYSCIKNVFPPAPEWTGAKFNAQWDCSVVHSFHYLPLRKLPVRKYDYFNRKYDYSKKINYLFWKYNLLIQKC